MFYPRYNYSQGRIRPSGKRVAAVSQSNKRGTVRKAFSSDGGMGGLQGAGGGMMQPYSPVYERAEDPTLAEEFMPTDTQTQNKIFRNIIMYDPIAGPATEYWRDMTFSRYVRLGGLEDKKVLQFYEDAIEASGIEAKMPWLLNDYLVFGRVTALFDMGKKGYWKDIIIQDPDFVEVIVPPFSAADPIINVQPTNEIRDWAVSRDPRIVEQRAEYDPEIIKLMALGEAYPLPAEHTLFMARQAYATDYYGTSYLTRIIPFKIMEKALIDAEIQAARRRAGPVWVISVPETYEAEEIQEIIDQFFAVEEDAVGGKVAVRGDVTVTPVGGGKADFWTLSDEYDFLKNAKMNALGISEAFLDGSASYNSMDKVLYVFLEKLRAMRAHFTEQVIENKMLKNLARMHDYTQKKQAQFDHHYRIAKKEINDSDLLIPKIEWDRPLEPQADLDYWDLLERLDQKNVPVDLRKWSQAGGFDLDEAIDNAQSDLEDRAKVYQILSARAKQAEQAGFTAAGEFIGEQGAIGGGGAGGGFDFGGGSELGGGSDLGGGGEAGGGGGGLDLGPGTEFELAPALDTPPATPELPTPEPPAGGGAGASLEHARFPVQQPAQHVRYASPHYHDLEKALHSIAVWRSDGTTFGIPIQRVAQIINKIAQRDPRDRDVRQLTRMLVKEERLNSIQSGVVQYCAARLGFLPNPHISTETIRHLQHMLTDRAERNGLNQRLNQEFEILARVAKARNLTPVAGYKNLTSRDQVPDHQILTGIV